MWCAMRSTFRVLSAENVTSSETAVMKTLLAPVVALGVKVLGTITDAQESERLSVEELWPQVPHQVCQFHVLRDAAKSAFEADKRVKTAMRKKLQPKIREVRKQLKKQIPSAKPQEAEQLAVLDDYAAGILTALNTDGLEPFKYATVEAADLFDEVEASLQQLSKKGGLSARAVCKSWRACRRSWPSGPPGQSNWRRSNACTAGCSRSNTSWTATGRKRERA